MNEIYRAPRGHTYRELVEYFKKEGSALEALQFRFAEVRGEWEQDGGFEAEAYVDNTTRELVFIGRKLTEDSAFDYTILAEYRMMIGDATFDLHVPPGSRKIARSISSYNGSPSFKDIYNEQFLEESSDVLSLVLGQKIGKTLTVRMPGYGEATRARELLGGGDFKAYDLTELDCEVRYHHEREQRRVRQLGGDIGEIATRATAQAGQS
jgi:hypothetical protein